MANRDVRSIDQSSAQEVHNIPEATEATREEVVDQWGGEEEAQAVKKLMAEFNVVHERDQALAKTFKAEMRALLVNSDATDVRALEDLAARIRRAGETKTKDDETTFVRMTTPERAVRQEARPKPVESVERSAPDPWDEARADMLKNGYIDAQGNLKQEIPGWTAEQIKHLQDLQKKKWADAESKIDSRRVDRAPVSRDQLIAEKQQRQTELLQLEARIKGLKEIHDDHGADEFSKDAKRLQQKIEEIDRRLVA